MARRDEEEYPWWVFDGGATKPEGLCRENPQGGESFGFGLRCRERHSPLRGCSARSASPNSKIPSRSASPNFQTGSYFVSPLPSIGLGILASGCAPLRFCAS